MIFDAIIMFIRAQGRCWKPTLSWFFLLPRDLANALHLVIFYPRGVTLKIGGELDITRKW